MKQLTQIPGETNARDGLLKGVNNARDGPLKGINNAILVMV